MLILKITGFILLGIIGLILLLLALVLFLPVRYTAGFKKDEDEMSGDAKITWLLGFVCIKIKYADQKLDKQGRVAFKKLWKKAPKSEEETKSREPMKTEGTEEVGRSAVPEDIKEPIEFKNSDEPEKNRKPKESKKTKESKATERPRKSKKKAKKKAKLSPVQRLKNLFKNRDLLEIAWDDGKEAVKVAFIRIKKLLLHVIPKRIEGNVEFGFSDPATTGEVLGAVSVLYARTGALLNLKPDFENEVFNCDVTVNGRVRIFTVALIAVLLYFNKDLRKLGKRVKRLSEKVPEGE